jgi:hypothetical protein
MDEENILKNALKLYVQGKNNFDGDKDKARELFEKSLNILTEFKKLNNNEQFKKIAETTEAECIKYIKNTNNIFDIITRNDLNGIKKIDHINFREINEHGNTVLHHTIDIGDTSILKEMLKKGGMIDTVNGNGHTLLDYACLKKDPNMISFLLQHGANMQKHLFFRKGDTKYYLNKSDIDIAILLKLVIVNSFSSKTDSQYSFSFLDKYFSQNELIGLDKFTIRDLIAGLNNMFIGKESYKTYKTILIEELDNYEEYKQVRCIHNKIDIVLTNMVPFINYPYNIASIFLLKNEIKYLMNNILNNNKKEFKNILMTKLFDTYIQNNLFTEDYIGTIVFNILSKTNNRI